MGATKKRSTASERRKSGRYRGLYLRVSRAAATKAKKKIAEGSVLLAVGDPGADGWVPVLYAGVRDHVQRADVERIRPKRIARPSAAQQAARAQLVKRARVKVSRKEAERLESQWRR